MTEYFQLVAAQLLSRLAELKVFISKHNPTVGVLTETVLRDFLATRLPKSVEVAQGFVVGRDGVVSRQVDVIIFDCLDFVPHYRLQDLVVVPADAVLAVIEVKTTIDRRRFHEVIRYFAALPVLPLAKTFLFVYRSNASIKKIARYFNSFRHDGDYQQFDHDTFAGLPDEIISIDPSYALRKDRVIHDEDLIGYASWYYQDAKGTPINALQLFLESLYEHLDRKIGTKLAVPCCPSHSPSDESEAAVKRRCTMSIHAIPLFQA